MPANLNGKLLHTIGRWSLTGLVVNMVIGSGIFGLPAILTRLLGDKSPWAYVAAAVGIAAIAGCLAEVGSQFSEAGGPYLYARVAYGRFAGIQIAWLTWLVRLTSGAANANIFIEYLGGFFPGAQGRVARGAVLFVLIGVLAAVNILGARAGANVSSFFAVAKIAPLLIFIVAGLVLLHGAGTHAAIVPAVAAGPRQWLSAVLLIIFAMSGFEAALIPMGEARDARRDIPFALFFSLAVCAVLYILIQIVVLRALGASAGDRPLAEAARVFLGNGGAALMQIGALLSVYGNLSSQMLNVPRITFALAERGDFPASFGAVSRRFRTPHVSIAAFAAIVFLLALLGNFSGQCRVVRSGPADYVRRGLRGRDYASEEATGRKRISPARRAAGERAGAALSLALVTQMGMKDVIAIAGVMALALVNWVWARRRIIPAVRGRIIRGQLFQHD